MMLMPVMVKVAVPRSEPTYTPPAYSAVLPRISPSFNVASPDSRDIPPPVSAVLLRICPPSMSRLPVLRNTPPPAPVLALLPTTLMRVSVTTVLLLTIWIPPPKIGAIPWVTFRSSIVTLPPLM